MRSAGTTKDGTPREVVTMTLIDGSKVADDVAAIEVSLFQNANSGGIIATADKFRGQCVVLLGVRSQYNTAKSPPLQLTSSWSCQILEAVGAEAEKIKQLAVDTSTLHKVAASTWSPKACFSKNKGGGKKRLRLVSWWVAGLYFLFLYGYSSKV